jgi:hypothetical protein
VIVALTALGYDASNFRGYDFVSALVDLKDGGPDYAAIKQGINGAIYALIALDTDGYLPGADGDAARGYYLSYILGLEKDGGGWSQSEATSDAASPDYTAMVLQALAPYYKLGQAGYDALTLPGAPTYAQIKASVEKGVATLAALQDKNTGGFIYGGELNSESASQVLVALSALGYDGTSDGSFIKSVVDNLLSFRTASGGFKHTLDKGADLMASEQATYALVAYARYADKANSLYDISKAFDWVFKYVAPKGEDPTIPEPVVEPVVDDTTISTPVVKPEVGVKTNPKPVVKPGVKKPAGDKAGKGGDTPLRGMFPGVADGLASSAGIGGTSDKVIVSDDNPVVETPGVIAGTPTPKDSGKDVGAPNDSDGSGFTIKTAIGIAAGLIALALIVGLIIRARRRVVKD